MRPLAWRWIAVLVVAAVVAGMGLLRWSDAADRGRQSAADLDEAQRLAARVADANAAQPDGPTEMSSPELNRWIQAAAEQAALPIESGRGIIGIEPTDPQPISGADLAEVSVPVRMAGVSLRQTVTFCHRLAADHPILRIRKVSLVATPEPGLFSAEVVVAYLVPRGR